jgi:hypothetical protein
VVLWERKEISLAALFGDLVKEIRIIKADQLLRLEVMVRLADLSLGIALASTMYRALLTPRISQGRYQWELVLAPAICRLLEWSLFQIILIPKRRNRCHLRTSLTWQEC